MFGQLFVKECRQAASSLVYLLYLAGLLVFFLTQLGTDLRIPQKPQPGKDYGMAYSTDEQEIMEYSLASLVREYCGGSFVTYPVGFYKEVRPGREEKEKIGTLLQDMTGKPAAELQQQWVTGEEARFLPKSGLSFGQFQKDMEQVDEILGKGSSYAGENLGKNSRVPKTYEQAVQEYRDLTVKDKVSGGYARLFCDYLGIVLGILPVFVAVSRGLKDRRARMSSLVYSRKASSLAIIGSRYLSMVMMMFVPVLLLSVIPLAECIAYGKSLRLSVDIFAFLKYGVGWLLPELMAVTALGMAVTELTDTALAVLIQCAWWFLSIFAGGGNIGGGAYGWNLVLRHNTAGNYQLYREGLGQIICNRVFYVFLGVVLAAASVWIYSLRRKGRLDIRGKILANRKRKS